MAIQKKHPKRNYEIFQDRILALQTLYTNKELSQKFGVSASTLTRYRDGKSKPKDDKVYEKINRTYNTKKSIIEPEKIKAKEKEITKRKDTAEKVKKHKKIQVHYGLPTDLLSQINKDYKDAELVNKLIAMGDDGFSIGWIGSGKIPSEVIFLAEGFGTAVDRWGKIVCIVCIMYISNSNSEKYTMKVFKVYKRLISNKLNQSMTLEEKHNYFSNFLFSEHEAVKPPITGRVIQYLGFYFEEGDEI